MGKKRKLLLVNSQFTELYISGMTNRFVGLWCYLQKHPAAEFEVHWLTNKTLWDKFFPGVQPPSNVTVMKANLKRFKFTGRLFYPFYTAYVFYRRKCTSIHVGTTIVNPIYLAKVFNFFKLPYCFTYGNNSIEMGSYDSESQQKHWTKFFMLAKNVDVLNPVNTITKYRKNKFISPSSFPYIIETNDIAEEKFLNTNRENLLVFCASFTGRKNPLFALEGFHRYLDKYYTPDTPSVILKMVGKGELLPQVKVKIETINKAYGKELVCLEKEGNLVDLLSRAKVFLSVQDFTNYPSQSLMEAMLFCNNVISIDNGETKRLVVESNNNILLKEKDVIALAGAIHQSLTGWALNLQNRDHILQHFSPGVFTAYLAEIHEKIIAEN